MLHERFVFYSILFYSTYTRYISRWFNFREFRESLIVNIFTLIHVYLH